MSIASELNKWIEKDIKAEPSFGLTQLDRAVKELGTGERLTVYIMQVTTKRLQAFIIRDGELLRLIVPEAGHRLYEGSKLVNDGYQFRGGGYSFAQALHENLLRALFRYRVTESPNTCPEWNDLLKLVDYLSLIHI